MSRGRKGWSKKGAKHLEGKESGADFQKVAEEGRRESLARAVRVKKRGTSRTHQSEVSTYYLAE